MGKLTSFTFISLNGFYKGINEDISWHRHGEEETKHSENGLKSGNTLLFGRVTYEMMAGFWPSPMAYENFPVVARGMNRADKIVVSNTLTNPTWENTQVINNDIIEKISELKKTGEKDITVLGSGMLLTQLAEHNLVDEFQILINPVAIEQGTSLFSGATNPVNLKLLKSEVFDSGSILNTYLPLAEHN